MAISAPRRSVSSGTVKVLKTDGPVSGGDSSNDVLVVNFSRYYNGGKTSRGTRVVPLSVQFRNLGSSVTENRDEREFFSSYLYSTNEPREIFISHPSFEKDSTLGQGELSLMNVVIRMHSQRRETDDLVLVGNFEKPDKGDWEYFVTGFHVSEPVSRYFGEIEKRCRFYARIKSPDNDRLTIDIDGKDLKGRPETGKNNLICKALVDELKSKFVVPNHKEVVSSLDDWSRFLDMREHMAGKGDGFIVERPEVIAAYGISVNAPHNERDVIVRDGDQIWTEEILPGSSQAIIIRVRHIVDPDLEDVRAYLDSFNSVTRENVKIVDPLVESAEGGILSDEVEERGRLSRLGERIDEVRSITSLTQNDLKPLKKEKKKKETQLDGIIKAKVNEVVAGMKAEYMINGEGKDVLEGIIDDYEDSILADATALHAEKAEKEYLRLAEECMYISKILGDSLDLDAASAEKEFADAPDKLAKYNRYHEIHPNLDLGSVAASLPLEGCISDVKEAFRKAKYQEVADAYALEIRPIVEEEFATERAEGRRKINEEYDAAAKKLSRDLKKNEIVVYFKIPRPEEGSIRDAVEERNKFFENRSEFYMIQDDTAELASIKRQRDAIDAVRSGSMANPFMAAFLYLPEFLPTVYPADISHYFGRNFNELQRKAVAGAVASNGLFLIQGPPGTGKTQVIAEIAAQEVIRGRRVLITSQGNKAVDNAFERLRPYPFIRSVRLMAMSKENDNEVKHLLENFYSSTGSALADRIRQFGTEEEREVIAADIAGFRERYGEYLRLKAAADGVNRKIRDQRRRLKDVVDKANLERATFEKKQEVIYSLNERKDKLLMFETRDYDTYLPAIRNLFPDIPDGIAKDNVLFGPGKICAGIMSLDDETFVKSMTNALGSSPAEDNPLVRLFPEKIPANLATVRVTLSAYRDDVSRKIDKDIAEASVGMRDTLANVDVGSSFSVKIKELSEDEFYVKYREAEDVLMSLASDMFARLKITESCNSPEKAKSVIDDIEVVLRAFSGDSAKTTDTACKYISYYLTKDGIADICHDELIEELMHHVNVLGMTCTAKDLFRSDSADDKDRGVNLREYGIDTVIIDEVSKVPFPELIRPMAYGTKIILVGDHKQLPPVYNERVEDDEMKGLNRHYAEMYTKPLFKTLYEKVPETSKVMLTTQYRMAGQIMGVINRFYGGELEMGCSPEQKLHHLEIDGISRRIITADRSVLFVNCDGMEKHLSGSRSTCNPLEAETVARLVRLIDSRCFCDSRGEPLGSPGEVKMTMGVITPYADQMRTIRKALHMDSDDRTEKRLVLNGFQTEGEERFMVKSVDDFQGDERDIIILSLVRTKASSFISDFRRINVAMSRARRLLIIVGKAETLCEQEIDIGDGNGGVRVYKEIIDSLRENDSYIEADEVPEVVQ